jgi:hypothetical protein
MSFYIRHRFGGNDRDPPLESIDELLRELDEDPDDHEHPSVSVVHESDWALAVYSNGLVTLENVEDLEIDPRHMTIKRRDEARPLLRALAQGQLPEVFAAPWRPGYGG